MAHPAFARTDHRPWPLPARRWTWRQRWCDLLFAHWPVPSFALRRFVPEALQIDEFEGTSWVGIVPFRMEGVTRRPLPPLPGLSAFPELNLRLYVTHGGKPGVWFLSLDAANALAVWAARRFFHLPYHHADMSARDQDGRIHYRSARRAATESFAATYGPVASANRASPGSLEHFLTERYCLYTQHRDGTLCRVEIHHPPWPLQRAEAALEENTLAEGQGLALDGTPHLLHFSRAIDVVVYPAEGV